jgi:Tfp pilus assembly protein PilO
MDLKKPVNLSSLINIKVKLKGSSLEHSKFSLSILIVSSIIGLTFFYLAINRYKNQDIFQTAKIHYEQTVSEKNMLDTKFKKLAKDNADYFSDVVSSPKTKMELSNALTQLIARYNLNLAKMNLNSADPSKGEIIEIEIDGSYSNIIQFSEDCKKIIAASELQSYKLTKIKEGAMVHIAMSIKFNAPPLAEALPLPANNILTGPSPEQKVNYHPNDYSNAGFLKVGFVPAKPENIAPEAPGTVNVIPEQKVFKDPFQAPSVTSSPQKGSTANPSMGGGYFLSGIMYSKEGRFCTLSLPSGESKIFRMGEKVGKKFKIISIHRNHILTNSINKKIFVGDEIL